MSYDPCSKCHTNINKTTAILKHIGILGRDVRSGVKAELCPRFDVLYLNPEMNLEEEVALEEEVDEEIEE